MIRGAQASDLVRMNAEMADLQKLVNELNESPVFPMLIMKEIQLDKVVINI